MAYGYEPHVKSVLSAVEILYSQSHSILMSRLMEQGGVARESDIVRIMRADQAAVRQILTTMSEDGIICRDVSNKKFAAPVVSVEPGYGYRVRGHYTTDALISVDYKKFASAVAKKVEAMLATVIRLNVSDQRYACTNSKCPNSTKSMVLIDLKMSPAASHPLQCPRSGCRSPAEPIRCYAGLTFEQAIDHNRDVNSRAGALMRLVQEGDEYLKSCGGTDSMTPAGAQLAGDPHPVAPLPKAPEPAPVAEPPKPTEMPEFLVSKRRPEHRAQKGPEPKRAKIADADTEAEDADIQKLREWERAAAAARRDAENAHGKWTVKGRVYRLEELTDALIEQMDQPEAERYAAWYSATLAPDVLFDPDS